MSTTMDDSQIKAARALCEMALKQRITDLEDALNLAAGALESRSDAMFRRNCAADARRVLRAKVQP